MSPITSVSAFPYGIAAPELTNHCPHVSASIRITCLALAVATQSHGKVKETPLNRALKFVQSEDQSRLTAVEREACIKELENQKDVVLRTGTSRFSGKINKINKIIEEIERRAKADPKRPALLPVSIAKPCDADSMAELLVDRHNDIQIPRWHSIKGERINYVISHKAAKRAVLAT
jgi:hypothetical protein